jgi:hypothetical protein
MRRYEGRLVDWAWRRIERVAVLAAIAWVWIWTHTREAETRVPRDAGAR